MAPKKNRATMDAEAVARLMAAQEQEQAEPAAEALPEAPQSVAEPSAPHSPPEPTAQRAAPEAFDPGKVDGRTLRRTGREPFATRIRPETHEALRRIAYTRGISIAEAVEQAVSAFERTLAR